MIRGRPSRGDSSILSDGDEEFDLWRLDWTVDKFDRIAMRRNFFPSDRATLGARLSVKSNDVELTEPQMAGISLKQKPPPPPPPPPS